MRLRRKTVPDAAPKPPPVVRQRPIKQAPPDAFLVKGQPEPEASSEPNGPAPTASPGSLWGADPKVELEHRKAFVIETLGAEGLGALGFRLEAGQKYSSAELISALRGMDVEKLKQAGVTPYAAVDADRTLWKGRSATVFGEFLIRKQAHLPEANPGLVAAMVAQVPTASREALLANTVEQNVKQLIDWEAAGVLDRPTRVVIQSHAFKGLTPERLGELGDEFWQKGAGDIPPFSRTIYGPDDAGSKALIHALVDAQVNPYLVTVNWDVTAQAAARALGFPPGNAVGTELEVVDGKYTGEIAHNVEEEGKAATLWNRFHEVPLLAIGDNPTRDGPMLETAVRGLLASFKGDTGAEFGAKAEQFTRFSYPPGGANAIAAHDEPFHHLRVDNAFFRGMYVDIPAGQPTQAHTHAGDIAFVSIGESHFQASAPDGLVPERALHDGEVLLIKAPATGHVLTNLSADRPFRNVTVELIGAAPGEPLPKPPELPGRSLLAENAKVRMWRVSVAPGETVKLPQRDAPGVLAAVSSGSVRVGGETKPLTPGEMIFHAPGADESVTNTGSAPVELRYVERLSA